MEEYRPWIVDRNIIKLRFQLKNHDALDKKLTTLIISSIDSTMAGQVNWKGKKVKLENIMQRQAYRLASSMVIDRKYRGYRFKW